MIVKALLLGCWLGIASGIAQAQHWHNVVPEAGEMPAPRRNAAAIYDPEDHRVIVFGGKTAAGDVNDVWALELEAGRWTELTPDEGPAPAPRFTPNGVYDPEAHRLIIWSGQGSTFFNDVWAFDLTSRTWTELAAPAPHPNIRYGAATVFDPGAHSLVTFAGFTDAGRFDDTWRFDLAAEQWTDISSASGGPEERCLHTASYDARDRRMIIYGGQRSGPLGDVWALDLEAGTWTELTPTAGPAARYFSPSIYDTRNHQLVIFGGNRGGGELSDEVWALDLARDVWREVTAAGGPSAREGVSAVYVEAEDRMIVFGGHGAALSNEVWALEGLSQATPTAPETAPPSATVLHPSYPNPAGGTATLAYELAVPVHVALTLYDALGREVETLVDAVEPAGRHAVTWDGRDAAGRRVSTGTYLYRLQADGVAATQVLTLIR